ncbi:hypothetical protein CWE09_03715 [Aliidiomarina minuta]|uniref:Lipoprotein n=1 Tax=Aliidiomarina minuta TaxID=880057 RepID=A0A432W705_9GAMM|nr:hypothetical protein [Aliidiomarina minuta]RUO25848.1 hypothetical protein CWE09_03715 [Aliidiomarina minuta]
MLQRLSLLLGCSLALMACSEPPQTLQFKPDDGEHRRYQMYSETFIEATSSRGSDSERVRTHMFMDYDVEEQSSTYDVLLQPQYIRMRFRRGGFSSLDAPDYRQEELWPLMEGGFTMQVDKQSGEATDFIIHHNIDRMDEDGFDPIRELLQDEFSRPGYGSGITLREGATQQMPAEGPFPEVTLTVKELDDQLVTLLIEGENDEIKLYGYILMERSTGWLKRSTLIVDMPLQDDYVEGTARMVATVLPADWQSGQDLEFLRDAGQSFPIDTSALPDTLDDLELASEAKVFPTSSGSIDDYDDKLSLRYIHDVFDMESLGHIEITDFQALDQNGDVLDLTLHGVNAFTYHYGDDEAMQTGVDVYPLGWTDMATKLEQLAAIEATVQRFPVTYELVELPVEDSETVLEHHGARAILTPADEEGVYYLKLEYTEKAYFGISIDGPSDGSLQYDRAENTPDWLDDGERSLLEVIRQGYYPTTYTLYFADEGPNKVRLMTFLIGDEPVQEKQVRFYDPDAALSNIELEPTSSHYLFSKYPDYANPSRTDFNFQLNSLQNVEPVSFDRPQLYMALSHEQAALCELQQTSDVEEAGRAITWREHDPREQHMHRELSLPQQVVYQLATEDGVREFFYEHEVVLSMSCGGEPEWHALDLELGEQSWLIAVTELLGDDWQDTHSDMVLVDLLRRYRFLDTTDRALTVIPPPGFGNQRRLDLTRLTLDDFVTEEGFLRIAGRVERVEELQASGDAFAREWEHQFPALPSADAAHQD